MTASFGAHLPSGVGVAVSGGSDSLALLHLMARLAPARLEAVTVDHRLRPEAAGEAREVAAIAAGLGIRHEVLVWDHGALAGNLQDQARRARYRLIGDWARARGLGHVVLGHTADDRAETLLMELARQAGLSGLTAMRSSWDEGGVIWSRPLLAIGRAALRSYLGARGIPWIDDPGNADPGFQRVRARQALTALGPTGITAGGLARVAGHLAAARAELALLAARTADSIAATPAGSVTFDRAGLAASGPETRRRLVGGALCWVAAARHPPRAASLARVLAAIEAAGDATLWGCRIRAKDDAVRISREPQAVAGAEAAVGALWDGRWRMSGPAAGAGIAGPEPVIRALGAEGLRRCEDWRATGLDRATLIVTPAIWRGETLVAAPIAGFGADWSAEIVTAFRSHLLSH